MQQVWICCGGRTPCARKRLALDLRSCSLSGCPNLPINGKQRWDLEDHLGLSNPSIFGPVCTNDTALGSVRGSSAAVPQGRYGVLHLMMVCAVALSWIVG